MDQMIKFFAYIFAVLVVICIGVILSGDLVALITPYVLVGYLAFVLIYLFLYLILETITRRPLSVLMKYFLVLPTIAIPIGFSKLNDYFQQISSEKYQIEHKQMLLAALSDVPPNANVNTKGVNTDNLKDEQGNQPTFKWGKYELTSFSPFGFDNINVKSLTQPNELPQGIQCMGELVFERKPEHTEDSFSVENFAFKNCYVAKLSLSLNRQLIQLANFELYYDQMPKYEYNIKDIDQKVKALLKSEEHYWVAFRRNRMVRIGERWIGENVSLIFNQEGTPIMLLAQARHLNNLPYTKINECMIKSTRFMAILTDLQDEKATLHTKNPISDDFSDTCPETIQTTLTYAEQEEWDDYQYEKLKNMPNRSLLQPFQGLSDEAYIGWNPIAPSLVLIHSNGPFFWGELKISRFTLPTVTLEEDLPQFTTLYCPKGTSAYFDYRQDAKDDSLNYANFKLTRCEKVAGQLWFGKQSVESMGEIRPIADTTFLEFIPEYSGKAILRVADGEFYFNKLTTTLDGNVISAIGTIDIPTTQRYIKIGQCAYHSQKVKLSNFSDKYVDISLFSSSSWIESIMADEVTPSCTAKGVTYQVLPVR
ncbi:hypothetical protein [Actinobacillus equuli]|uniref:hypothetical protein n=1 Tax=Actinobacillus equuli TaxID=718 RepID=UPI0024427CF0|nr:hypothetical protein [Actinobacillus equuli]WGE86432.1 hypothetical protein NYR87_04310 [Actinobacillus equuli subsp. haemolyticus]